LGGVTHGGVQLTVVEADFQVAGEQLLYPKRGPRSSVRNRESAVSA
jgi:hypothetical protein